MYRYNCGAPAQHTRPSGLGTTTRPPYWPAPRPYRPDPGPTRSRPDRPGPRHYSTNHTLIPRFPYRPPTVRPCMAGPSSYRTASGYPYTRPVTVAPPTLPPPRPPTPSTSTDRPRPPATYSTGRSSGKGRSSCEICSFSQKAPEVKKPVFHEHFSSKALRELLDVEFALSGSYFCPSCKRRHAPYPTERTKIVLSDSTLHNFFAPPSDTRTRYEGDTLHVDYLTIPGAPLETLFHAFKLEFSHHTKPMDLFIVAGYNDLVKNHGRDYIVETFKKFGEYVRSLPNEENTANTVTVGTLLYPPQLSWFKDDGPEPQHYTNQKDKINWINREIAAINIENGIEHYVGIHKYGLRVANRKHTDEFGQVKEVHIKQHRWDHWRERVRSNMLHLSNDRRVVLGKAINEYFIHRT